MNDRNKLIALQNAATTAGLIVHENFSEDKRKTVKKYFLQSGNTTVSPVLNFDQMNHFLLGWLRGLESSKPPARDSRITDETIVSAWEDDGTIIFIKTFTYDIEKDAAQAVFEYLRTGKFKNYAMGAIETFLLQDKPFGVNENFKP